MSKGKKKRKPHVFIPELALECLLNDLIEGGTPKQLAQKYGVAATTVRAIKIKYLEVKLVRKGVQLKLL